MVKNLPSDDGFALQACYEADCSHPVYQRGKPTDESVWYAAGASLQFLPLPVPDPKRPWGPRNVTIAMGVAQGT